MRGGFLRWSCAMTTTAPRYTPEIAERILQELRSGRTLLDVCSDPGMPAYSSVMTWLANDHEGFVARCEQARAAGGAAMGAPTHYTPEIAERIIGGVTSGRTLAEVCSDPGMPLLGTVKHWILKNRDDITARYKAAQEIGIAMSGRMVPYSAAVTDRILGELMLGRTLTSICRDPGMPSANAVLTWVKYDREGFKARYHEARDIGNQLLSDELRDIGDDSTRDLVQRETRAGEAETVVDHDHINRSRLRCDNLKWILSRVLPKTYGDRIDVNAKHDIGDSWAELLKAVNNQSRGLPNQYRLPHGDGDENE
jgi:hypothetical protein